MKNLLYIARRTALAAILLMLLALAPVMAQTVVYTGEPVPLSVVDENGDTYSWEIYNNGSVNFATVPGLIPGTDFDFVTGNTGASVQVIFKKTGIYFFKVTAYDITGCTMNIKIGMLEVKLAVKAEITPPVAAVCAGDPISLEIIFSGTAPWNFTYTATDADGVRTFVVPTVTETPYHLIIDPGPLKTTDYTVIKVSDVNGTNTDPSNTVTQTVNPLPAPKTMYHR